jgi:hypothetical protein
MGSQQAGSRNSDMQLAQSPLEGPMCDLQSVSQRIWHVAKQLCLYMASL